MPGSGRTLMTIGLPVSRTALMMSQSSISNALILYLGHSSVSRKATSSGSNTDENQARPQRMAW